MPFEIKEESEFIQACVDNKIELVETFLQQNPELVNTPASNGSYPLMFAAEKGHLALASLLLKSGANINANVKTQAGLESLSSGTTALLIAAYGEQWEMVKLLLNEGMPNLDAAPTEGEDRGLTVLWMASIFNQWDIVKLLLEKGGCNLNVAPVESVNKSLTVLWFAGICKQWGIVKLLLEKGAGHLDVSPTEGEYKNKTLLFWTFLARNDEIFRLLLNHGISLSLVDNPIINLSYLQELLIKTDPRHTESNQLIQNYELTETFNAAKTLFMIANSDPATMTEQVKKTLENVLAVLCRSEPALNGLFNGKTALHAAIEKSNQSVIEALVINGANLLLPDDQNNTAQSLSDLPIISAFVQLYALDRPIEQLQKLRTSNLESKQDIEALIKEIERLKKIILAFSKDLKPKHKNKLCYELGKLLEKALPYIDASMVIEAFSNVSAESRDLYQEASAALLHYKMVSRKTATVQSLDDEPHDDAEHNASKLALALLAGSAIEPWLLSHVLIDTVSDEKSQAKGFGLVKSTDTLDTAVKRTLAFLRTQAELAKTTKTSKVRLKKKRKSKSEERPQKSARVAVVEANTSAGCLPQYSKHVSNSTQLTTWEQADTNQSLEPLQLS